MTIPLPASPMPVVGAIQPPDVIDDGAGAPLPGAPGKSIGAMATHGMIWSIVQNWGGRALNFALFVMLARFLSPAEFGVASASAIIILLITTVAEFGFADAIIQRPGLKREDVNLPFYFSMALSTLLSGVAVASSGLISRWFAVPHTQPVIIALSLLAPLSTFSLFQEMQYKRHLAFQKLAFRVLVANLVAAFVSIAIALAGGGVWALVAQTYVVTIVGLVWMWSRPYWTPSLILRPASFRQLARFSIFILLMRLLDFGATRFVEVTTIGRYGVRPYGLYAASSRLNQTMLDMLQAALSDVSLSVLSKIADQRERLAAIYRVSTIIAANLLSPFFLLAAALSDEICDVLFGNKWVGIGGLARILFFLGAVQVIQFLSRPYLNARGRSETVLLNSTIKFAITVIGLIFLPHHSIYQLVSLFVVLQLLNTPISFYLTTRELGASLTRLTRDLAPVVIAGALADRAVWAARPWLVAEGVHSSLLRGVCLGAVYLLVYLPIIVLIGRSQILLVIEFVRKRLKGKEA